MPLSWKEWLKRTHKENTAVLDIQKQGVFEGMAESEVREKISYGDGIHSYVNSRDSASQNPQETSFFATSNSGFTHFLDRELIKKRHTIEKFTEFYVSNQTAIVIAHALHQPLTALTFYSFVLKKSLDTDEPDLTKIKDIIDKCCEQSQRATDVIKHLMVFLSTEKLSNISSDINGLINSALNYMRVTEDLSSITIKLKFSENLRNISVNPLHIEKVIIALVMNALEAMEGNKENDRVLTIVTHLPSPKATMVEVSVIDNGKSISDSDTLHQLFKPFYSTKTNGIGMGLPISKTLIESYGGKIWAEQNAKKGLCVKFTLPFES
ncbi:ATP-binding protein [Nitrosomonas sp. JL21]|nr:ATP-binding protein [Nitrosomonas sp. JL21]